MSTEEIDEFEVHGEKVGVVRDFVFLGAKIDDSGSCKGEILRRLALGRAAMTGLNKIWKDKYITITTKCRIVNALVFPVVLYGCESWTIRKVERRIMDSFELRCWRRLLRIPWTARRTNKSGIEEIEVTNPLLALEALIKKQQLSDLGRFRLRSRNQTTIPTPIPESESESESFVVHFGGVGIGVGIVVIGIGIGVGVGIVVIGIGVGIGIR